mgnify:CR=1 FL=1
MPRPSPTPAEMPGRLVIFGAAQGMGRWLAEQIFAEASLQLVLVDVSHHIFEHSDDQRPNPPLRLQVAYEGGNPVFTGADGGAARLEIEPDPGDQAGRTDGQGRAHQALPARPAIRSRTLAAFRATSGEWVRLGA